MLISLQGTPSSFAFSSSLHYGEADGISLYLSLFTPEPLLIDPAPAVVYIDGAGWETDLRVGLGNPWMSPLLAAHGFIAVEISYRLSWQATFPAQLHDAKAAVRWLRAHAERYHIDPQRIGAWGDSAGGHLASLLGVTGDQPDLEGHSGSPGYSSKVQAVIARVAPSDFLHPGWHMITQGENPVTRLFGGSIQERAELMKLASPITHVTSSAPPFQIVHGTHDETVPFEQAERLVAVLQEAGIEVEFLPIQGVYHNLRNDPDLPWAEENWEQLGWQALSFFQKHLGMQGLRSY